MVWHEPISQILSVRLLTNTCGAATCSISLNSPGSEYRVQRRGDSTCDSTNVLLIAALKAADLAVRVRILASTSSRAVCESSYISQHSRARCTVRCLPFFLTLTPNNQRHALFRLHLVKPEKTLQTYLDGSDCFLKGQVELNGVDSTIGVFSSSASTSCGPVIPKIVF